MGKADLITEELWQWINAQAWERGARLPTVRALAVKLGRGRMRLNRAVAELVGRGCLFREGQRLFIGDLVRKGGARPPLDLYVEKWHEVRRVASLAQRWGIEVRCHRSVEPADRRRQLRDLIAAGAVTSGVLVYGAEAEAELTQLSRRGVPVVILGARSFQHSYVSYDPALMGELAVQHLHQLGHREIAFIASPAARPFPLTHQEVGQAYVRTCQRMELVASVGRFFEVSEEAVSLRKIWQTLRAHHRGLSALICEEEQTASALIKLARGDGLDVPRELSIMCVYDHGKATTSDLPITAMQIDYEQMIELAALSLLLDQERAPTEVSQTKQQRIVCLPRLMARASTTEAPPPVQQMNQAVSTNKEVTLYGGFTWPEDAVARCAQARALNEELFSGVNDQRALRYHSVDLEPWANRLLARHYGWLGQLPLLHLPPGVRPVHGVPCRILKKAIVLRSRFARSSSGVPLPESFTIPIQRQCDGVFILHAGGWLRFHEVIGQYEFHLSSSTEVVEVAAYGSTQASPVEATARQRISIIQDWHPSTPAFTSAQAKPYLITRQGDPLAYLRCLYLYHWPNPRPGTQLISITLRTLQPELQATLGVLAVTLYRRGKTRVEPRPKGSSLTISSGYQ
jgi:DNA-binding LacI/PurR family transcriptional regulator